MNHNRGRTLAWVRYDQKVTGLPFVQTRQNLWVQMSNFHEKLSPWDAILFSTPLPLPDFSSGMTSNKGPYKKMPHYQQIKMGPLACLFNKFGSKDLFALSGGKKIKSAPLSINKGPLPLRILRNICKPLDAIKI